MNSAPKKNPKRNPYKRVFDDANRALEKIGGDRVPKDLPEVPESEKPRIPFPYGRPKGKRSRR